MDSPEQQPQESAGERPPRSGTPAPARWFQRVLPVSGVVVILVAAGALVSPSFRDQVRLSLDRQHQPYVELYFTPPTAPAAASTGSSTRGPHAGCVRSGSTVLVRFVVASHLQKRQAVAYRVAVAPVPKRVRPRRRAGTSPASPGERVEVATRFAVPRRAGYTVSVVLPGLDQRLRAHCPAGRS